MEGQIQMLAGHCVLAVCCVALEDATKLQRATLRSTRETLGHSALVVLGAKHRVCMLNAEPLNPKTAPLGLGPQCLSGPDPVYTSNRLAMCLCAFRVFSSGFSVQGFK